MSEIPEGFVSVELFNLERETHDRIRADNAALRARVAELEGALVDCVIELTELVSPEYGPLVRARAVLAHGSAGR